MDYKELKKLAATCRAAGIKHFKNSEMEFTLTEDVPVSKYKKKQQKTTSFNQASDIATEDLSLTDEQLLMWSTGDVNENQ